MFSTFILPLSLVFRLVLDFWFGLTQGHQFLYPFFYPRAEMNQRLLAWHGMKA